MSKKLLLIDGNSLVYRAYFATAVVQKDKIFNSQNVPVNAVRTFNTMLSKWYQLYKPTHLLVAFDASGYTKRHDKLATYKANRQKTPNPLLEQMPIVKQMLKVMKIRFLEKEGDEADDIIATAVKRFKSAAKCLVLTSDKDLYQLVQKNVDVINPQNKGKPDKVVTADNFHDLNNFSPTQVCDFKALAGDSSDNLQGVRGIGPKQAIQLIQAYESLEGVYQNLANIPCSVREKLVRDKATAFLCKSIAKLNLNVDVALELGDLTFEWNPNQKWVRFFRKHEIYSLVKKYENHLEKRPKSKYENLGF